MHWISSFEHSPRDKKTYLVTDGKSISIAWFSEKTDSWLGMNSDCIYAIADTYGISDVHMFSAQITHFMSLPDANDA